MERKIIKMIHALAEMPQTLTWDNLTMALDQKLAIKVARQTLYVHKKINDEFQTSKAYQSKLRKQSTALPYKNLSREGLRKRILELQTQVEVLKEELSNVRAQQYDQLSAFSTVRLNTEFILQLTK